jgi:hypothetical protein
LSVFRNIISYCHSKSGKSPLDIAKEKGHTTIVDKLSEFLKWRCNTLLAIKDKIQSPENINVELAKKVEGRDAKIRELKSANGQDVSGCDLEDLYQAVISHGRDQWFSICLQMGYRGPTVMAFTTGMTSEADKIRAVIEKKIGAVGERAAGEALLEACKRTPDPIIGGVMDSLRAVVK